MARKRYADYDREHLLRAVRLYRLPGVTRTQACERFGLSLAMLKRALNELGAEARPSRRDLVLHSITNGGRERTGQLSNLRTVASYLDYVNKDGSTAEEVMALIDELVGEGVLAVEGSTWTLLGSLSGVPTAQN